MKLNQRVATKSLVFLLFFLSINSANGQSMPWITELDKHKGKEVSLEIGDIHALHKLPTGLEARPNFSVYRYDLSVLDLQKRLEKSWKETGKLDFDDSEPQGVRYLYILDELKPEFEAKYQLKEHEVGDLRGPIGHFAVPVSNIKRRNVGLLIKGVLWQIGDEWVLIVKTLN